jgi:hypothetical protein
MANKVAISLIHNLIEDLVQKSQKLTDQKRYEAMMRLVDELEEIKNQMTVLGLHDIWEQTEKIMQETPKEYGSVLIQLPFGFKNNGRGERVKLINFTELFNK